MSIDEVASILLYVFLLTFASMPRLDVSTRFFRYVALPTGVAFVALHYAGLTLHGTSLRIYPLLYLEEWRGEAVISLDWGQAVLLCLAVPLLSAVADFLRARATKRQILNKPTTHEVREPR
ncbi:MAG: hypothetical protein QXU97_02785 [Fervidicoccaceae archaeon]